MTADTLTPQEQFARFVDEHDLAPEDFPLADTGPKRYGRVFSQLMWAVSLGVLDVLTHLAYKVQLNSWPIWAGNPDSPVQAEKMKGSLWLLLRSALYWIDRVTHWLWLVSLLLLATVAVLYAVNVVKRKRRWERDVIKNDREARKLKTQLVRRMRLDEQITALDEAAAKKNQSASGDDDPIGRAVDSMFSKAGGGGLDPAQQARRDMLVALRDMQVNINTRQDVSGDSILRMWRVTITEPDSKEASKQLRSVVDNELARDASRVATQLNRKRGGRRNQASIINFGEPVQSSDYTRWTLSTALPVEDKYAVNDEVTPTRAPSAPVYEPAFDLTNLIDHTDEIATKSAGAKKWADNAAKSVDAILTTDGKQVNRKSVEVSAKSALFTYALPDSATVDNFDSLTDVFNKNFRTESATVQLIAGDVLITIPLPDKFNIPIDVGSMFRDTFF